MLNLIKAYRANRYWIKAHAQMGGQFQGLALVSIRRAIKLEPDLKKIPAYLELEGHIESSIGKLDIALKTLQRALEIINDNPREFNSVESQELRIRLQDAVGKIENTET